MFVHVHVNRDSDSVRKGSQSHYYTPLSAVRVPMFRIGMQFVGTLKYMYAPYMGVERSIGFL